MKGIIRHSWQGLICIAVVGGVLLYQFFSIVVKSGYGTGAAERGVLYTLLIVAAVNLYRVFLNKTPVFRIEAASVLYTYNTDYFRKSLILRQLFSILFSISVSGLIACVLSGFLFSTVFFNLWLLLSLYISNCSFLSWINYHVQGKIKWCVCAAFLIYTILLLLRSVLAAIPLVVFLCASWIYVQRFLRIDTQKYYERLQRLEAASAAASRNDYVRMQQLADENRPSYVRGPLLYHLKPTKKTALWIKSILELFRIQRQIFVLLAIIMLAGWIVSRTDLLTFLSLPDAKAIARVIAVFCTTAVLSSIYQLLIKQAKAVSDKRRLGLSLPYSTKQIIVSYGMTAMLINLLLSFVISLLYTAFSIRFILLLSAETTAWLVPCCTRIFETKFQRAAAAFSNLILFAGVYYYLMA